MSTKKPKYLTLREKSEIIEHLERGQGASSLSRQYGVAKSTISAIRKNKDKIFEIVAGSNTSSLKRKTLKQGEYPRMEGALHKWFLKQRSNNLPVDGDTLKEKAKLLHEQLQEKIGDFHASSGWLSGFKSRYGVRLLKDPILPLDDTTVQITPESQPTSVSSQHGDETISIKQSPSLDDYTIAELEAVETNNLLENTILIDQDLHSMAQTALNLVRESVQRKKQGVAEKKKKTFGEFISQELSKIQDEEITEDVQFAMIALVRDGLKKDRLKRKTPNKT